MDGLMCGLGTLGCPYVRKPIEGGGIGCRKIHPKSITSLVSIAPWSAVKLHVDNHELHHG